MAASERGKDIVMEIAIPRVEWAVEDVLSISDDGGHARHELVDGLLIVSPMPGYPHQRAVTRLVEILGSAAKQADAAVEVFGSANVQTVAGVSIPDVIVAKADAAALADVTLSAGDMVAVVEIVSGSSRRMDRLVKPEIYAESGIGVFWRVTLQPEPMIEVFTLAAEGGYRLVTLLRGSERLTVERPFPVTISPMDLVI